VTNTPRTTSTAASAQNPAGAASRACDDVLSTID